MEINTFTYDNSGIYLKVFLFYYFIILVKEDICISTTYILNKLFLNIFNSLYNVNTFFRKILDSN